MPFQQVIKKHWPKAIVVIVAAGAVIYFIVKFSGIIGANKPFVPPEFLEAKSKGAVIAERIVSLSKESITNLAEMSAEDEIGNYTAGLELILKEVERNKEARDEALELSKELGKMTASLTQVKPEAATRAGLEAIINESQIVQRLINYNSYIFQLLDILQGRFTGGSSGPGTDEKVKELIGKMNEEAKAVNELNEKYKIQMSEFNKLTFSN